MNGDVSNDSWTGRCLKPENGVVFVDTKGRSCEDATHQENEKEARIIEELVEHFVCLGVDVKEIVILSPYRRQLGVLKELMGKKHENLDILTVDQAQGKDKSLVIVSFVRSNNDGKVGKLLKNL